MQLITSRTLCGLVGLVLALMLAMPVVAQDVSLYSGTLMIGFGDSANKPPNNTDFGNDGVPACANAPNQFFPATFATKTVMGRADQSGVVPRTIVFPEQSAADGGQQTVKQPPCIIQFPPFLGNQRNEFSAFELRSHELDELVSFQS